jgi:hypothetical protein
MGSVVVPAEAEDADDFPSYYKFCKICTAGPQSAPHVM